ncbi:MAG TPA: PQQ-binding-like beta-propeller repeat protein, partial [Polyangiaceae bacterium]|nr:PQQ-binding-like beta-propeller repeat protein [Polyangiaceae bacterium]
MNRRSVLPWSGAVAVLLGVAGCRTEKAPSQGAAATQGVVPGAVAGVHMIAELPGANWTTPAGDLANTRFSPLAQITVDNAKTLHVTSTFTTGVPHGHEGQPLVVDGTMYVVTPFPNDLIAVDLKLPGTPVLWRYRPSPDPRSVGIACCDVVNRGASYADGKIIYNLLDAHTVAVDAKTGKEAWRTQIGDINRGETITMAPLVVKDEVFVGNSGGEMGVRGKLVALDVHDGRELWRGYNTGPDADMLVGRDFEPFYEKDRGLNQGVTTWPPDQWQVGGATVWGWVSYDPELDLVYYGTSNPGVWNPDLRPGDNKWSASILARHANGGGLRWAYQVTPHDSWDYDEINESVLVDMDWKGQPRKLLLHAGRNGFLFVMDRRTGEVLSADAFEPTNWASGYDLTTGKPIEDPSKRAHSGETTRGICPS